MLCAPALLSSFRGAIGPVTGTSLQLLGSWLILGWRFCASTADSCQRDR